VLTLITIVASESVGVDVNGGRLERDIEPGELVIIDEHGTRSFKALEHPNKAFCMFEYVYFARVDSILEDKSVYQIRYELGKNLAKMEEVDADIVVPVPDSARPAAAGYSQISGLPVVEGLIKNRYVGRTFIMPFQKARDSAMRVKINPIIPEIKNKRIVLIDDSIVRGTTSKRIVDLLKHAGAKEIHFRVTCPPLIGQCFYGIDISSRDDLIASDKIPDVIRREIHADTLVYQSIDGLVQALRTSEENLCLGCLTLKYPTPTAQNLSDLGKKWDGKDD
jgi:amidophosphoribosyltransferase